MANEGVEETPRGQPSVKPIKPLLKQWIDSNNLPNEIYHELIEQNMDLDKLVQCRQSIYEELPTISQICNGLQDKIGDKIFTLGVKIAFIEAVKAINNDKEPQKVLKLIMSEQEKILLNQLEEKYTAYSIKLENIPTSIEWIKLEQSDLHKIINEMFIKFENKLKEKKSLFDQHIINKFNEYEQSLTNRYKQKMNQIQNVRKQCNKIWEENGISNKNIDSITPTKLIQNILLNNDDNDDDDEHATNGNDDNPFKNYQEIQQKIEENIIKSMDKILNIQYNDNYNLSYNDKYDGSEINDIVQQKQVIDSLGHELHKMQDINEEREKEIEILKQQNAQLIQENNLLRDSNHSSPSNQLIAPQIIYNNPTDDIIDNDPDNNEQLFIPPSPQETIQINNITKTLQSMGYEKEYIFRAITIHKKTKKGNKFTLSLLVEILERLRSKEQDRNNKIIKVNEDQKIGELEIPPPPKHEAPIFIPPPPLSSPQYNNNNNNHHNILHINNLQRSYSTQPPPPPPAPIMTLPQSVSINPMNVTNPTDDIIPPPPRTKPYIFASSPKSKKKKNYKKRNRLQRATSDTSEITKAATDTFLFATVISHNDNKFMNPFQESKTEKVPKIYTTPKAPKITTDKDEAEEEEEDDIDEEEELSLSEPSFTKRNGSVIQSTVSPLFNSLEKDLFCTVFGFCHRILSLNKYRKKKQFKQMLPYGVGRLIVSFVGTLLKVDRYGFPLKNINDKEHKLRLRKEAEFLTKWTKILYPNGKKTTIQIDNNMNRNNLLLYRYKSEIIHWDTVKNNSKIKILIRREGLPQQFRGTIWQNLCGARELRKIEAARYGSESLYYDLKIRKKNRYHKKIWMDICSTYTDNIRYNTLSNNTMNINLENIEKHATPTQHKLYRILKVFSIFRGDIGYECCGMHDIAALLLMHMTEQQVFWVLVALTDINNGSKYKMDEIWRARKNPIFIHLRIFQLKKLIQKTLPKIYKKIWEQFKINYDFTECFQTIFLSPSLNMNFEFNIRIWDLFLNEGIKTIFRVIIGYLKYYQKYILKCQTEQEIIKILDTGYNSLSNVDQFFKICFSTKMTHADLAAFEREFNNIIKQR